MKFESPPVLEASISTLRELFDSVLSENETLKEFLHESDQKYFYWSDLKYRPNLPFENPTKAWQFLKMHRIFSAEKLKFHTHEFMYNITSFIQKDLHHFDLKLMGGLYKDAITKEDQNAYLAKELVEEAIASSQIEGAATTTDVARKMIQSGRKPRNESEQMIVNNFRAIKEIEHRLEEDLSRKLILEIHELVTSDTSASKYAGQFRDHPIYVTDHIDGTIAFTAPKHEEVLPLIDALVEFINTDKDFVHPIVKASILHFMVGYIHPFGDGNGRMARTLFYWFLIKKGYSLLKHISISKAILESKISYDKAFLKTEHDDNDLTYFILYSMKSLRVAFQNLVQYRDKKRRERQEASEIIYQLIGRGFSKRQADLLSYLSVKPNHNIAIVTHAKRHGITRQTASRDLEYLKEKGILLKFKDSKNVLYRLANKNVIRQLLNG